MNRESISMGKEQVVTDPRSQDHDPGFSDPRSQVPDPEIAISVQNLTKIYKLYDTPLDRLKESINPFGKKYHKDFYALNDVSFEIKKGETFGVIGYNGAGKSTLLKIITGVLTPTSGSVQVQGNVSALLELGSGFNPELTGLENVFFNGTLAGFSREQIENRLDDVLAFADIGEFVHQPVKMYSSGMFIRLAFAVSTMLDPKILILDEALAVGDIFFQQKCFRRLEHLQASGVAMILVSHALGDIMQHCKGALVLNKGESFFLGDARAAVKRFFLLQQQSPVSTITASAKQVEEAGADQPIQSYFWPGKDAYLDLSKALIVSDGLTTCTVVAICDEGGVPCHSFLPGADIYFYYEFEVNTDIEVPVGGVIIYNNRNIIVHGRNTLECPTDAPSFVSKGHRVRFRQRITLDIGPGGYTFSIGIASLTGALFAKKNSVAHSELTQACIRLCIVEAVGSFTVSGFPAYFPSEKVHNGLCNLPGDAEVYLEEQSQERESP